MSSIDPDWVNALYPLDAIHIKLSDESNSGDYIHVTQMEDNDHSMKVTEI